MSRNWHTEHTERGISIGEGFSFSPRVYLVNPTSKCPNRYHPQHCYVLWFGACAATYLHVYADSLEDALEECAAWVAEHAPGHIMAHGSDELVALYREAFEEIGLTWDGNVDWNDRKQELAMQSAESDLTYTESGYLTSYEWGIALEDPTTEDLYRFIGGRS